jgi:hypothetical protein
MDPFFVPRTTFTLSLKLVQFPFEVGMRMLGGGDDDRVEARADRADPPVVEKPRRRPATTRRRAASKSRGQAAKSSGQTGSRRARSSSRQRQTTRRGQAQRQTAAPRRQAPERKAETTAQSRAVEEQRQAATQRSKAVEEQREAATQRSKAVEEQREAATQPVTAATEQREAATAHSEAETLRALHDVQERIEAARGEVGAGHRETPAQRPTEAAAPDEARDDTATQERREHNADRPGAQAENTESAHQS